MDWNTTCENSIRRERLEIEKKYGIKIGQTEISCARCGKSWGFGGHVCADRRFEKLHEESRRKAAELKTVQEEAYEALRNLGPKKVSVYLMLPEDTVKKWNHRRTVPRRYVDKILNI